MSTETDVLTLPAKPHHREPPHIYLSTACRHGLHECCREQCKFCEAKCTCACHSEDDDAA